MNRQVFNIFDPVSEKKIGKKERTDVHRNGDWHVAANAYVVRANRNGDFELLVQRRSMLVDIAQNKLDQSVATQLITEDDGDIEKAIMRGLHEELSISKDDISRYVQFNTKNSIKIIKRYQENIELWNRELINVFIVLVKQNAKIVPCPKISNYEWISWEEFKNVVILNPLNATKTSRLFIATREMSEIFENFVRSFIEEKKTNSFDKKYIYVSDINEDMCCVETENSVYKAWLLDAKMTLNLIKTFKLSENEVDRIVLDIPPINNSLKTVVSGENAL